MTQQDIHDFMTANGFIPRHVGEMIIGYDTPAFFVDNEQAELMFRLTLEARRDENMLYMDRERWYYPGGPGDAYIPCAQILERLAELNNQLSKDKEQA